LSVLSLHLYLFIYDCKKTCRTKTAIITKGGQYIAKMSLLLRSNIIFCDIICFLALYVVVRPSVVCNVRAPTQAIEIFRNVYTPFGTLAIPDLSVKILRRSSQGTSPSGELNTRGVAEYSDFGPIERYISEMVQDRS